MESPRVAVHILAQLLNIIFTLFAAGIILSKKGGLVFKGCPGGLQVHRWVMILAIVAIIAAVYVAMQRSSFLPFLGATAFPHRVLKLDAEADTKKSIRISVPLPEAPADALVVYWAASSSEVPYPTPGVAYMNTDNVGVTKTKDGMAVFALDCPAEYMVRGSKVSRHVHYRVQLRTGSGMFGPVQTLPINC